MKLKNAELREGPEAFSRFREALRLALSVPKSALPERPMRSKKKAAKGRS